MIDTNLPIQLRKLRLGAMADALQLQLEQVSTYEELAFTERLSLLVDHELLNRDQNKQARLIRLARFKLMANIQDIDYQHQRNIKKDQIAQLAQTGWLDKAQNLLVTGPCGSGKTYLGCAVGHNACLNGYSTRYYRLSRLLLEMTQAKADGTYQKLLKLLASTQLLLIDDWGLEPLEAAHRHDLMEIMD
ncbi:MAG TPA: ATP-binding protein, partial [Gammaproteobacteria bacterium]|nr:ATP-binding protein [Gammaproteobacteria bacterium]